MTLVFLHGAYGSAADWDEVRAALSPRESVAIDLPGHGGSTPVRSFDDAVEQVLEVIPQGALGVGYSLGGRILLSAALRDPSRFSGLVLESAHPGLLATFEKVERLRLDMQRAQALKSDPKGMLTSFWKLPLFAFLDDLPQRAELLAERIERASQNPHALAASVLAMSVAHQPDGRSVPLAVPSLLVSGALDQKYNALYKEWSLRSAMDSRSRMVSVENAGHNVHLKLPAPFAKSIAAFADEIAT